MKEALAQSWNELAARPFVSGTPIGGIGAGCIEFGPDGYFRNITINNNRTAATRIPVWDRSFLAVRASGSAGGACRILQPGASLPFAAANVQPVFTPEGSLSWEGAYPCAHYRVAPSDFPVELAWTVMSPIVPYDIEASSLPLIFFTLEARNAGSEPVTFSAMFNWENMWGCTQSTHPDIRGAIRPRLSSEGDVSGKAIEGQEGSEALPLLLGLEFGSVGACQDNAHGHYALSLKQEDAVETSVMAWRQNSPEELRVFWQAFAETGKLPNLISQSRESHCGAVCGTTELSPGRKHSFVFLLAWHCPRFEVDGVDEGNEYANRFANALDVTAFGFKHYRYFVDAVEDFRSRLTSSSLPSWLTRMLLNGNSVFSTNTIYTRDKRFAMFESPASPRTGSIGMRLYSSLATTLFFPDLERRELERLCQTTDSVIAGRVYGFLGEGGVSYPRYDAGDRELQEANASFLLMACRDFFMTGRSATLDMLYPKIQEAIQYVVARDLDQDGLPEFENAETLFGECSDVSGGSYAAGLWVAALMAVARLAQHLKKREDARAYAALLQKARHAFDAKFWNAQDGFYADRRTDDAEGAASGSVCRAAQLAGQWYADFLGIGGLFPADRVGRALESMRRLNEKRSGVANAVDANGGPAALVEASGESWPYISLAHYACLNISRGNVDEGIGSVQKVHKNIIVKSGREFDRPLRWNLEANAPVAPDDERHMGAASIWHVLFAMQGFFLNVPEQTLYLCPNLPKWVNSLNVPLVTPICWGRLYFYENTDPDYMQYVRLSFDGLIHVKNVVLRVPRRMRQAVVQCVSPAGAERATHRLWRNGDDVHITLGFDAPILIGDKTTIVVKEGGQSPPGALSPDGAGAAVGEP